MRHSSYSKWVGVVIFAALFTTACGKKADEQAQQAAAQAQVQQAAAQQKLDEAEKKLEEATKALEEAKQQADDSKAHSNRAARSAAESKQAAAKQRAEEAKAEIAQAKASSGWGQASSTAPAAPVPPPPPPPKRHTIPEGTEISVRTVNALSSKTNQVGNRFEASLARALVVDGYTVAPRGATVTGEVVDSDQGGRVKGKATLAVALTSLTTVDGRQVAIRTSNVAREATSAMKKDALKVGIASGIGAAIGAIAGGGKGAGIGAGIGAAGGTGTVLATRGNPAVIPSETVLTFQLASSFTVTETAAGQQQQSQQ
jgi:DNA polymerase III alpha subunit (gram-positive type)